MRTRALRRVTGLGRAGDAGWVSPRRRSGPLAVIAALVLVAGTIGTGLPVPASGGGGGHAPTRVLELGSNSSIPFRYSGHSLATSGDTVVVGAPTRNTLSYLAPPVGNLMGAVVIYERGPAGLERTQSLTAPDDVTHTFGWSVDIHDDTLVVGAPALGGAVPGKAFVYDRVEGVWTYVATLQPDVPNAVMGFGQAVAVHGDRAAVGAPQADRVSTFARAGGIWAKIGTDLQPGPGAYSGHRFGSALAMNATHLVVGAPVAVAEFPEASTYPYIFLAGAWQSLAPLTGQSMAGVDDEFGTSVALSDTRLVVGAPGAMTRPVWAPTSLPTGSTHVFDIPAGLGAWTSRVELAPAEHGTWLPDARVGSSVAISGNAVAVTAPEQPVGGANDPDGAVYVFGHQGGTWLEEGPLLGTAFDLGSAGQPWSEVGVSVAISGTTVYSGFDDELARGGVDRFDRSGGTWSATERAVPDDRRATGQAVAVGVDPDDPDARWFFVGVPQDWTDHGVVGTVRASKLVGNGSSTQPALQRPAPRGDDRFGRSLAYHDGRLVVGAPGAGQVEFFELQAGTWVHLQTLSVPGLGPDTGFGEAVAIDGARIVVGAPRDDTFGTDAGSVQIFEPIGASWFHAGQVDRQMPAQPGEELGASVALRDGEIVAGAPGYPVFVADGGAVLRFTENLAGVWVLDNPLGGDLMLAPTQTEGARLGTSLAASERFVVAGAPGASWDGSPTGGAVIWEPGGYQSGTGAPLSGVLTPTGGAPGDRFGSAVAVADASVVVGARASDLTAPDSGSAQVYVRQGGAWGPREQLTPDPTTGAARFGAAVALSEDGDWAIVGAPRAETNGDDYLYGARDPGMALAFELTPPTASLRVASASGGLPTTIIVDGIARDLWGLNWLSVPSGSYEVCFSDVPGFVTEPCTQTSAVAGETATVTYGGTPQALLQVTTSPPLPATISVRDVTGGGPAGPANAWGVLRFADPGRTLEVCFGPVAGFAAPPCAIVPASELTAGAFVQRTGTYTQDAGAEGAEGVGLLRVTTDPALPSNISIDGVPANGWGLDWVEAAPGSHEVCFTDVPGFTTPACSVVEVQAGETTEHVGTFVAEGSIQVSSNPPSNATVTIDGVPRNNWGAYLSLPLSGGTTYTVCMGASLDTGQPPTSASCIDVDLTPGQPHASVVFDYG